MVDAEAVQRRASSISTVDYNRCGGASPLRVEFDLDTKAEVVELANIRLGNSPEPKARLIVSGHDGVPFRFIMASREVTQTTLQINESALLVVTTAPLLAAAAEGKNLVALAGKFTRQLSDGRSSDFELRVEIELFRSGPPRAALAFEPDGPIDFANPPVDGNILLGSLTITPENSGISVRGRARIVIDVDLLLPGSASSKASLRAHRLRQDADDRVWQKAERPLSEELVLEPAESRFTLHRVDIGISYTVLREWLAISSESSTLRNVTLELHAEVGLLDEQSEPLTKLEPSSISIEVIGLPHESVRFVGLGPPMPMVFALGNAGSRSECRVATLRLSAQALARRQLNVSPLLLEIEYDGWSKVTVEVECKLENGEGRTPPLSGESMIDPQMPVRPTAEFEIGLPTLLAEVDQDMIDRGPLSCSVAVTLHRFPPSGPTLSDLFVFSIPVVLEAGPMDWLACVDFGTSSTAVWMGRSGNLAGVSLRLGDWLSQIDPRHDESAWWKEVTARADERASEPSFSYLLPSHVGLSSAINLRADYDPLSLGDLALSEPDEGQLRRLTRLQRSYDVSVPFPSSALMARYGDTVVTQPKRRMVGRADHVALRAEVAELHAGNIRHTRHVNLAQLIGDCFHELGSYVANRALALDMAPPEGRRADAPPIDEHRAKVAGEIVAAQLKNSGFGLVVTHPSGISRERLNIYRDAGRRFVNGFCGGIPPGQQQEAVMLVAEALAAARFGIQHYAEASQMPLTGEPRSFITLDIGGGTYDVTVLETRLTLEGPIDWNVKSHFGLARGGYDMDSALAARVTDILRRAAQRSEIASRLEFQTRLPHSTSDLLNIDDPDTRDTGMRFLSELQAAKARLTQALLGPKNEPYLWARRAQGGPAFNIHVGTLRDEASWPVRLKSNAMIPSDQTVWPIPGTGAELAVERTKQGASLRLRVWREAFEGEAQDGNDRLSDLIKLMATELPRLAWIEFMRKAGTNQQHPPVWIITGRAALWPPLFETIAESIAAFGPEAGHLAQLRPFSPDEMKHAVVQGAVQLAREPWAEADFAVYNPVAVITYKLRASFGADASPGRAVADIIRVHDDNQFKSQRIIETTEPFVIARILPGLDDEKGREARIELFNRLGIEPWVELEREMPRDTRRGGKTRWTVTTRRDLSGLFLTFDSGNESGSPITFGPLKEGRIYGSD